ncbi:hypothetical protein ABZ725_42275 [Streptomyces sp. NPDC006872]|uniref:hypothetical protein n=1 Tax=Streptomyces sp. NPDC006872 TaxID=3155720 RepID=UPI00340F9786
MLTATDYGGVVTHLVTEDGRWFTVADVKPGKPVHRGPARPAATATLGSGREVRATPLVGLSWAAGPLAVVGAPGDGLLAREPGPGTPEDRPLIRLQPADSQEAILRLPADWLGRADLGYDPLRGAHFPPPEALPAVSALADSPLWRMRRLVELAVAGGRRAVAEPARGGDRQGNFSRLGDVMNNAYSPVEELNLLKDFQDKVGYENFAGGFGLTEFGDISGLVAGWSDAREFTDCLLPFAQATGGGSFYALWKIDDRPDPATLPVVVFGDEGGEHVVARHLREFFQLLGFDEEISVDHESAYFYRDEDEPHTDSHEEYVAWLDQHFGLPAAEDPDAVLAAAQTELGQRFADWIRPFLP